MKENLSVSERTTLIRSLAEQQGFQSVGISKAEFMEPEAARLEKWLNRGFHGEMGYMENHFDLRVDPRLLVPGAKSVISLLFNYYPETDYADKSVKVSRYARGKDYHKVLKKKLKKIFDLYQDRVGERVGRVFVDSAPILERDWAKRSGLGWIGKNTLLINPKIGSYYFLAEIVIDDEFIYDTPIKDYCGTCTKCIDACPTDAIAEDGYVVDGSKCISYLTIELKNAIPTEFSDKMEGWVFGCDICQEVCPWNRFSKTASDENFKPRSMIDQIEEGEILEWTEEVFNQTVLNSPLRRAGLDKLKSSITFIQTST